MENVKQKFIQSHFLQPDRKGIHKDVVVRLIDKTHGSDPTKREFYWIRTLRTLYPDNLNIRLAIIVTFVFTSTLGLFLAEFSFPGILVNR